MWYWYSRTTVYRPKSRDSDWFWGLIMVVAVAYGAVNGGWGGAALAFLGACVAYGILTKD